MASYSLALSSCLFTRLCTLVSRFVFFIIELISGMLSSLYCGLTVLMDGQVLILLGINT